MGRSRYASATELCRCCLTSSKNMTHMQTPVKNKTTPGLQHNSEYRLTPKAMLENILSRTIVINDRFPSRICSMCLSMLKLAHQFQQQVEATQIRIEGGDFLKARVKPSPKSKKKTPLKHKQISATEKETVIPSKVRIWELDELFPSRKERPSLVNVVELDKDTHCEINENSDDSESNFNQIEIIETTENSIDLDEITESIIIKDRDAQLTDFTGGEEIHIEFCQNEDIIEETENESNATEELNNLDENEEFDIDFDEIIITEEPDQVEEDTESQTSELCYREEENDKAAESETKLDEILITCDICHDLVPKDSTDEHMKLHENPENPLTESSEIPREITCIRCQNVYGDMRSFRHHLKHVHDFSKPSRVCNKCDYVGQSDSAIHHHVWTHRGKLFKCTKCTKNYNTISQLRDHMKKHFNLKNYLCSFCGKGFNYWDALKYHLRLHSDKSLTCHICGLKFRMNNTLIRHIRTHTKEKPYPCDYCPKTFPSSFERKSHHFVHTGEKPYVCKYCPKAFAKSVNRTTHQMSHSGPFACSFCSKTFMETNFLSKHLKRKHAEDVDLV